MFTSKSAVLLSALLFAACTSAATSYDYIVVGECVGESCSKYILTPMIYSKGAGPAGLTVANRLSASGEKTVLVLEAGLPHLNDPAILIPGLLGGTIGVGHFAFLLLLDS